MKQKQVEQKPMKKNETETGIARNRTQMKNPMKQVLQEQNPMKHCKNRTQTDRNRYCKKRTQ